MKTVWVVRLAGALRRHFGMTEVSDHFVVDLKTAYVAAFASVDAAEKFVRETSPLTFNPFERVVSLDLRDPSDPVLWRDSLWFQTHSVSIVTLCARISKAGLEPPGLAERDDPGVWPIWWELVTLHLDSLSCLELARRLGLPSESAALTDVRSWLSERDRSTWMPGDGTMRFDWTISIAIQDWRRLLVELDIEPKVWPENTDGWRLWWDFVARELPVSVRDLLWWALVPYPYEIIELELEGGGS